MIAEGLMGAAKVLVKAGGKALVEQTDRWGLHWERVCIPWSPGC